MKIVGFDIDEFNKKDNKWILGNGVLYNMCLNYPNHTDPEEIRAKLWLIGRSYAVAIERRKTKNNINDDFYDEVIEKFIEFNKLHNFDERIKKLKNKDFNEETLRDMLLLHAELTNFFYELTELEKRSLASKYLHFHVPIFPIYDSRASSSINKLVRGEKKDSKLKGDGEYSKFCQKILFLYDTIKKQIGKAPTLREIDSYLVKHANRQLSKGKN
jgi:hypothetical protein